MSATASPTQAGIGRLFEATNAHDIDAMRGFYTDDCVERFPDRTCHGPDEIAAYFRELFAAVPDFRMDIKSIVEKGDEAFVRWVATGTHEGTVQGVAGTEKRIEIDGMDHMTLRDGKVASNFVVFDQMQWARAMGMMPPQDSPADRAVKAAFNLRTRALRRLRSRG